ncbi:hypothetical protein Y032_0122g1053 [Ancylostoma ceylanicum]|uniref:Uncharacterized protein n=1 Tax=Ancylostoma ceylanicum TaxID=53326 RepID=A0A016T9V1_9BILA|nr:hypothetical protein Y032_0122g1053 [Ancylostoma ceylanicum]
MPHRSRSMKRWSATNSPTIPFHRVLVVVGKLKYRHVPLVGAAIGYNELQTFVDKGGNHGAGTLVVCCTEAAGLLGRDAEQNRAAVPALVYDRLELTVVCLKKLRSTLLIMALLPVILCLPGKNRTCTVVPTVSKKNRV